MNIQSWEPDNCKCKIYTHTDGKHYHKHSQERHCKNHVKDGQDWFIEVRKSNNDLNHKYFPIGGPSDQTKNKIKLKQLHDAKFLAKEKS